MPIFNKRAELEARLGPAGANEASDSGAPYTGRFEMRAGQEPGDDEAVEVEEAMDHDGEPVAAMPVPTVPVDLDLHAPRPAPSPATASEPYVVRTEGGTILAPGTHFEGTLKASEPVLVAGTFQGTLEAEGPITVEAGGRLVARVTAPEIIVAGYIDGRVQCHGRLEVRSTGLVRGKIHVGTLRIEEGALLDGALQMAGATSASSVITAEGPAVGEAPRGRASKAARAAETAAGLAPAIGQ
jgi:cytoskeletal protein CcmA (bactofilin family)